MPRGSLMRVMGLEAIYQTPNTSEGHSTPSHARLDFSQNPAIFQLGIAAAVFSNYAVMESSSPAPRVVRTPLAGES